MPTTAKRKQNGRVLWTPEELEPLLLEDPAILATTNAQERFKLLKQRMKKVLPEHRWRSDHSLHVCVIDNPEQFDALVQRARLKVKRLTGNMRNITIPAAAPPPKAPQVKAKPLPEKPTAKPVEKPAAKAPRKLRIVANAGAPVAEPSPPPPQQQRASEDDNLLADAVLGAAVRDILTTAVGAGLAMAIDSAVRTNMQACVNEAIGKAKLPTRESLLADMEEMLTRLLGGPSTVSEPAKPEVKTEPIIAPIVLPETPIEVPPPQTASEPASVIVQPKDAAPHDITDQLEMAAKALGMPHVKRPSVVVCGLHPKTFEELERYHGRAYRFTYIKQDHFNAASDLPASAEALILSRKKLSHELAQAVRRYAIPMRSVANSLPAAEWALKEIFA